VLQQLLYADEVRSLGELDIDKGEVRPPELKLAMQLIEQISSEKFDPKAYVDEEKKRIETAIQRKIEGEQIAVSEDEGKGGAQIIDLMEALRASLDKGAKQAPAAKEAAAAAERKPAKRAEQPKPAQKAKAARK
jgi:DNA end-binding protein Ku